MNNYNADLLNNDFKRLYSNNYLHSFATAYSYYNEQVNNYIENNSSTLLNFDNDNLKNNILPKLIRKQRKNEDNLLIELGYQGNDTGLQNFANTFVNDADFFQLLNNTINFNNINEFYINKLEESLNKLEFNSNAKENKQELFKIADKKFNIILQKCRKQYSNEIMSRVQLTKDMVKKNIELCTEEFINSIDWNSYFDKVIKEISNYLSVYGKEQVVNQVIDAFNGIEGLEVKTKKTKKYKDVKNIKINIDLGTGMKKDKKGKIKTKKNNKQISSEGGNNQTTSLEEFIRKVNNANATNVQFLKIREILNKFLTTTVLRYGLINEMQFENYGEINIPTPVTDNLLNLIKGSIFYANGASFNSASFNIGNDFLWIDDQLVRSSSILEEIFDSIKSQQEQIRLNLSMVDILSDYTYSKTEWGTDLTDKRNSGIPYTKKRLAYGKNLGDNAFNRIKVVASDIFIKDEYLKRLYKN